MLIRSCTQNLHRPHRDIINTDCLLFLAPAAAFLHALHENVLLGSILVIHPAHPEDQFWCCLRPNQAGERNAALS